MTASTRPTDPVPPPTPVVSVHALAEAVFPDGYLPVLSYSPGPGFAKSTLTWPTANGRGSLLVIARANRDLPDTCWVCPFAARFFYMAWWSEQPYAVPFGAFCSLQCAESMINRSAGKPRPRR